MQIDRRFRDGRQPDGHGPDNTARPEFRGSNPPCVGTGRATDSDAVMTDIYLLRLGGHCSGGQLRLSSGGRAALERARRHGGVPSPDPLCGPGPPRKTPGVEDLSGSGLAVYVDPGWNIGPVVAVRPAGDSACAVGTVKLGDPLEVSVIPREVAGVELYVGGGQNGLPRPIAR